MKKIFPEEIINQTSEAHFGRFNSTTKIIYLLILFLLLAVFASLPILTVDITQQSRGSIRSLMEDNSITSAVYALVAQNRIKENAQVAKGDTLLILDNAKLKDDYESFLRKIELNQIYQNDLNFLLHAQFDSLSSLLYVKEREEYQQKQKELKNDFVQKEREYQRNKKLYQKKVLAKVEFEKYELAFHQAKQNKLLYTKQKNLQWQSSLKDLQQERIELDVLLAKNIKEKRNYIITAPVSGKITHFTGIQAGNFISAGQNIAQISPNSDLIVECYISPANIGYIKKEMKVNFQLDAFNYNQWGLANGKVLEISPDIFQVDKNAFFKVRCSLNQDCLELKNGYKRKLTKGMSLTARFVVTERSLFELLYDKVDDWLNPRLQNT